MFDGLCVLERTPRMLAAWLSGLPDEWLDADEGRGTWSARAVLDHLIEGERTNWMPRVRHILEHDASKTFPPFDRFANVGAKTASIDGRLDEFARGRAASLAEWNALALRPADLDRRGRHPEFGEVTLRQHLATWVTHDLSHTAQIARVMARRQADAVGPWRAYLPIIGTWRREIDTAR